MAVLLNRTKTGICIHSVTSVDLCDSNLPELCTGGHRRWRRRAGGCPGARARRPPRHCLRTGLLRQRACFISCAMQEQRRDSATRVTGRLLLTHWPPSACQGITATRIASSCSVTVCGLLHEPTLGRRPAVPAVMTCYRVTTWAACGNTRQKRRTMCWDRTRAAAACTAACTRACAQTYRGCDMNLLSNPYSSGPARIQADYVAVVGTAFVISHIPSVAQMLHAVVGTPHGDSSTTRMRNNGSAARRACALLRR